MFQHRKVSGVDLSNLDKLHKWNCLILAIPQNQGATCTMISTSQKISEVELADSGNSTESIVEFRQLFLQHHRTASSNADLGSG